MPREHKPSPTLRRTLSGLLSKAEKAPGQQVSTRLTNNLKIDLEVQDGQVYLQISRSSVWPSEAEWQTILRHWPYPVDATPKQIQHLGRHFLKASWPCQERLPL